MKVLAMADESTLNCQRKYLRCPTQVLSFFGQICQKRQYKTKKPRAEGHRAKELLFLNPFSVFIASFEYNLKFQHRVGRNG